MITADTNAMRAAVTLAKQVCRPSTMEILRHVLIQIEEGEIAVTASDTDCQLTVIVPAKAPRPVQFCVDAERLALALSGGDDLRLDVNGHKVTAKSGRSRYELVTLAADAYPMVMGGGVELAKFDAAWLPGVIATVLPFSNPKELHFKFRGVSLRGDGTHILATCATGIAMAQHVTELESREFDILIPRRSAEILSKLPITAVAVRGSSIVAKGPGFTFTSKIMEEAFPPEEVLRKTYPSPKFHFETDVKGFADAIAHVAPFGEVTQGKFALQVVELKSEGESMRVLGANNSAETVVNLSAATGDALDRHYQARLLHLLLGLAPDKSVRLYYENGDRLMVREGAVRGVITAFRF